MITIAKGRELAERLGTRYCESSAETGDGVHSVIDTAVRLAIMNQTPSKTKFKVFQWQRKTPKVLRHGPDPPVLSPPGLFFFSFFFFRKTRSFISLHFGVIILFYFFN